MCHPASLSLHLPGSWGGSPGQTPYVFVTFGTPGNMCLHSLLCGLSHVQHVSNSPHTPPPQVWRSWFSCLLPPYCTFHMSRHFLYPGRLTASSLLWCHLGGTADVGHAPVCSGSRKDGRTQCAHQGSSSLLTAACLPLWSLGGASCLVFNFPIMKITRLSFFGW